MYIRLIETRNGRCSGLGDILARLRVDLWRPAFDLNSIRVNDEYGLLPDGIARKKLNVSPA
jgi:hypothetical protein